MNHRTHNANIGLVTHPGIPFYLASWLALKVSLPAHMVGIAEIMPRMVNDPSRFLLATRCAALILMLVGVITIFACPRRTGIWGGLAAGLTFFAVGRQPWDWAFTRLTNESFALMLAAIFFIAGRRAFLETSRPMRWWFVFGLVCGTGYVIKLHYLVFAAGGFAGLASAFVLGRYSRAEFLRLGCAFGGGLLTLVLPLLGFFVGRSGTLRLLDFQARIFVHKELYGTGEFGLISLDRVDVAMHELLTPPWLLAAIALSVLGCVYIIRQKWDDAAWRRVQLPHGITILVALFLALAAILKHFNPHYMIVPFAILSVTVIYLGEQLGMTAVKVSLAAAFLASTTTLSGVYRDQIAAHAYAAAAQRDIAIIMSKPLNEGETRLWDYRAPAREFVIGMVTAWVNDSEAKAWYEHSFLADQSSYDGLVRRPWRYAVLDRVYYPDAEAVRRRWPEYKPSDQLDVLETTVLIERKP